MKKKIKIKDFNGNTYTLEKEIRAKDHLEAQQKYKSITFRDKTKFTRKTKHHKSYKNEIE